MTIAFDVGPLRANPAGVGVYVRSLALGLEAIGRSDLTYVGRRPGVTGLPSDVASIGRNPRLPYPLWIQLQAQGQIARSGAVLAHFTDGLVPLLRQAPTVLTVLDLSLVRHWRSHRLARLPRIPLVLASPRLADRVIAISSATADDVMRLSGVSAKRIDVIPLAPRRGVAAALPAVVKTVEARHGLSRDAYVLVPGTLEPRKNLARVIRAFEQLADKRGLADEIQLVVVGGPGWHYDGILRAMKESPLRDRIRYLGYVDDEDLNALMTGAKAVVYASTYEGFGLPVIEAMACGAPVVTSNLSSMPEVAGPAGFLVDPLDVSAIAAGIRMAMGADETARRAAREWAAGFTWERTAMATSAVYDSIL